MNTAPFAKQNGETQFIRTAELRTPHGREAIAQQLGFQTFEQVSRFQAVIRKAYSRPMAGAPALEQILDVEA